MLALLDLWTNTNKFEVILNLQLIDSVNGNPKSTKLDDDTTYIAFCNGSRFPETFCTSTVGTMHGEVEIVETGDARFADDHPVLRRRAHLPRNSG